MDLYGNYKEYAKLTQISEQLALVRCTEQKKIHQEIAKAKICPKCGKSSLEYEYGSYEENTKDYVYCTNDKVKAIDPSGFRVLIDCGFSCDTEEKYAPLMLGWDLDSVLFIASQDDFDLSVYGGLEGWHKYAEGMTYGNDIRGTICSTNCMD